MEEPTLTHEQPQPLSKRQRRLREIERYERYYTGGLKHIGHLAACADTIGGWTFRRCRCGFTLAMNPDGEVWWLRASSPALKLESWRDLLWALNSFCRFHVREQASAPKEQPAAPAPAKAAAPVEVAPPVKPAPPSAPPAKPVVATKPVVVTKKPMAVNAIPATPRGGRAGTPKKAKA